MEVILKKDIQNLGYTHDIIHVKAGFANNYLIPQGMAELATPMAKKLNAETLRQRAFKEEKIRKEGESLAKKLENITVKIGAKAGQSGKIYGSVNALQIADAIKEQFNYDVDRKKIHIEGDSIKEVGSYQATVRLHKDVQVTVNFEVFAE